ncbi:NETWORKED 4A-like protein [Tanacetum coccineum]
MAKLSNRGMNKRFLISEMDQSLKRMLELINEEGDSFAKRVEIYIQKRPQLVAQVQEFYRMFKSLSERYEKATSELRRTETSRPPDLRSHRSSYSFTEGCSEPPSTITSPEHRVNRRLSECQTIFDVFENRESYEASTLDSGSDSDDSIFNHYSSSSNKGNYQRRLRKKVAELEAQLKRLRIEQEVSRSRSVLAEYEEELRVAREKIQSSELEIDQLKSKLEKYESLCLDENYMSSQQANRIYALEEKLGGAEEEVIKLRQELESSGSDGAENEETYTEDDIEQLKLERDEFATKLNELEEEMSLKDDQIDEMNARLNKLQLKYEKSSKSIEELRDKGRELEKVVERQREVIEEGAEENRQAVKQLSFSLEHYRNAYQMLRQNMLEHKKPVMAS